MIKKGGTIKPTIPVETPSKKPINTPTPPQRIPTPKKTNYKYAGKETLTEVISKALPKQLIPTERITTIFGAIFILVLIIAILQFPFSSLMSGNIEITINVGYPWAFLELELTETDKSPLRLINLILDLIVYMILAYAIDIIINLVLKNPTFQSKKRIKQKPTIFKDRKLTIAEKVTEKIAVKKQLK